MRRLNSSDWPRGIDSVFQFGALQVLGEQQDLIGVAGVVRDLARDRLVDRVRLAANHHGALQVGVGQRRQRVEHALPAVLPFGDQLGALWPRILELAIAHAIGLLAVAGQEVDPARSHVAGHVAHQDRDAVRLGIDRGVQLLVRQLLDRLVGELLDLLELVDRDGEDGRLSGHVR